jgi:hypothetical protein
MSDKKRPVYDLHVERNGRVKARIQAFEKATGRLAYEDREDLSAAAGRTRAAKRLAKKLHLENVAKVEETLDAKWHEAVDEQRRQQEEASTNESNTPRTGQAPVYFVYDNQTYRKRFGRNGEAFSEPLANFNVQIQAETTYDDGSGEVQHCFRVGGTLRDGTTLPSVDVPASEFAAMNWPLKHFGSRAIVYPGLGAKDHLRFAIQLLSPKAQRLTVYRQTGFRKIDGEYFFLHAGGAVGPVGTVSEYSIDLPGDLALINLPDSPKGSRLRDAVRASLGMLDLARESIMVPILGAVYRAPLGHVDSSLHIVGPSGAFKTAVVALAQQHYGAGLDARHLPGSWSSTANALESLLFTAADCVCVIDDFAPGGSQADVARFHRDADRVIRSVGNRSARMRLRADGELRPPRPPRCFPLSTGEEVPKGHSVRARLGIVELSRGDIDVAKLTTCQSAAREGRYAAAMSAYLRYLAGRFEQLQQETPRLLDELRQQYHAKANHERTHGILADLALGWQIFLRFAVEAAAITANEAKDYAERVHVGLTVMGQLQAAHQQVAEPAAHFMRLVRSALASGRAHVASILGCAPQSSASAWGWSNPGNGNFQPQGRRIGWLDGEAVFLDPEAAHAAAQTLAGEQNDSLSVSCSTLGKRLHEQGYLTCIDQARERLTVRKQCQDARRAVWQMRAKSFLGGP